MQDLYHQPYYYLVLGHRIGLLKSPNISKLSTTTISHFSAQRLRKQTMCENSTLSLRHAATIPNSMAKRNSVSHFFMRIEKGPGPESICSCAASSVRGARPLGSGRKSVPSRTPLPRLAEIPIGLCPKCHPTVLQSTWLASR